MRDAIIIGGGHNGLVCAHYLAKAGLKVTVLERRGVVGGAAVTEEFHPGFRNSVAAYTVSLLNPKVIHDLELAKHGLRIVERPLSNFLPFENGQYLKIGGGKTMSEVAKFSKRDAERLQAYGEQLDAAADVLRDLALQTPPNRVQGSWLTALPELIKAGSIGNRMRKLPLSTQRELLDLFTKSAGDYLDGSAGRFGGFLQSLLAGIYRIVGRGSHLGLASRHSPGRLGAIWGKVADVA